MEKMSVRSDVIQFLHDELVGPQPGLPMVQLNGEEVLSPQDPPRLRYGAGILFPSARPIDDQEDDDAAVATASIRPRARLTTSLLQTALRGNPI